MKSLQTPQPAMIVERQQETPSIFTLRLRLLDESARSAYAFEPGQFNMLYLHGVGEVPISITSAPCASDLPPEVCSELIDHTIRAVGRVTHALAKLKPGDQLGLRGPFGHGWPLTQARGRDLVFVTGGLGCAPVVSVIRHALHHRSAYQRIVILQGVKHHDDLIWKDQYQQWAQLTDTQVLLAASQSTPSWPWHTGPVTALISQANFDPQHCSVMMCGPEMMMAAAAKELLALNVPEQDIWMSMERNMQCALGHCGHCQYGSLFICKDGPVLSYTQLKPWLGQAGV